MADLISRDALLQCLEKGLQKEETEPTFGDTSTEEAILRGALKGFREVVEIVPAVDAVSVRHGHWIDDSGDGDAAVCSCCGECYDTVADYDYRKGFELFCRFYRYCPSCGAKMDKEVKEDG